MAKSVVASVAESDPVLDEVSARIMDAANSRAGVIVALPQPIAYPASDQQIESLVRTFLDSRAGPAEVVGTGVITARNIVVQEHPFADATAWFSIDWSLTGSPDWQSAIF